MNPQTQIEMWNMNLGMMSLCQFITLVQTEISQLLVGLPQNFVQ